MEIKWYVINIKHIVPTKQRIFSLDVGNLSFKQAMKFFNKLKRKTTMKSSKL